MPDLHYLYVFVPIGVKQRSAFVYTYVYEKVGGFKSYQVLTFQSMALQTQLALPNLTMDVHSTLVLLSIPI